MRDRIAAVIATVIAALGGSVTLVIAASPAYASCVGPGRAPLETARPGQVFHLSGTFLLACRDTGGGPPFPAAKAPARLPVSLSELPGYRHYRTIGHVRTVRVVRPRSGTPMAKFRGTVQLPANLKPGRYSLEVYGSWGKRIEVPASAIPQLPTTGTPADLMTLWALSLIAMGGTILIRQMPIPRGRAQ